MTSELEEMGKMWEMRGQTNGGETSAVLPNLFDPYSPLQTAQLPLNQHKPEMFHLNSYYAGYDLQWSFWQVFYVVHTLLFKSLGSSGIFF